MNDGHNKFLNRDNIPKGSINDRQSRWLTQSQNILSDFRDELDSLDQRVGDVENVGVGTPVVSSTTDIIMPLGSQFLLDPNEFNGWSVTGPTDDTSSQDLGNVGAAISRIAGGFTFPFDVRLVGFLAHHYNNNSAALPWGWRIAYQIKTAGSNSVSYVDLLNEVDGAVIGPRDYGNTTNQITDLTFSSPITIPAKSIITMGVEAPTAEASNYYVRVMGGYMHFERA